MLQQRNRRWPGQRGGHALCRDTRNAWLTLKKPKGREPRPFPRPGLLRPRHLRVRRRRPPRSRRRRFAAAQAIEQPPPPWPRGAPGAGAEAGAAPGATMERGLRSSPASTESSRLVTSPADPCSCADKQCC